MWLFVFLQIFFDPCWQMASCLTNITGIQKDFRSLRIQQRTFNKGLQPFKHSTKDFRSLRIASLRATNKFLISYDVCSLFTGIPLKETIDIAANLLFEHNPDFKITKNEFKISFTSLYQALIFFLMVVFLTKLMV